MLDKTASSHTMRNESVVRVERIGESLMGKRITQRMQESWGLCRNIFQRLWNELREAEHNHHPGH